MSQYRVYFSVLGGFYYTEWFDTIYEARGFYRHAFDEGIAVYHIENEDGDVI